MKFDHLDNSFQCGGIRDAILFTERLLLRLIREDDIDSIVATLSTDTLRALGVNDIAPTWEQVRDIIRLSLRRSEQGSILPLAVCQRPNRELIGAIEIVRAHHDGQFANMGFWMGESYRGRGYMVEAIKGALLVLCMSGMNVLEIRAAADPTNWASIFVLRKSGFREIPSRDGGLLLFALPIKDSGRNHRSYT